MTGPDELYQVTENDAVNRSPALHTFIRFVVLAVASLAVILPLWFAVVTFRQATFNWMDGNGFTPISHGQPVQEITPASFTIVTLPGEAALR